MNQFPKHYIGCANSLEKDDERLPKYIKQYEEQGFDDTCTWSLDNTIAEFIVPRLKRFKEVNIGYPNDLTPEQWDEILDKMVFAFEQTIKYDSVSSLAGTSKEESIKIQNQVKEGLTLFAEYFHALWW